MSGGERRRGSGHSGAWSTGVTKAAVAGGPKGLVSPSRALRILPPDSPAGMTGELGADLWGVQRGHPQIYLHALVSLNKFLPCLLLCGCLLAIGFFFFFFFSLISHYFEVLVAKGFSHFERAGVNFEKMLG